MGYVLLALAAIMGLATFRIGRNADWHWAAALLAAMIPVAFTFFSDSSACSLAVLS